MSDIDPQTPPQDPGATDGGATPPAATNPQGGGGATNDNAIPEGFELIRTEDKNNLISSRDRGNNANAELEDAVTDLLKDRDISTFLSEHSEKFQDVTKDDLMLANSPEQLEALATKVQRRVDDAVQKKLMDVQKADAPALSPQERAAELKKLKDNPGSGSFQRMLELQEQAS